MRPIKRTNSGGFTLLELSFVVLISGIIFAAIISVAKIYLENVEQEKLVRGVEQAKLAITGYKNAAGRYPCPAKAGLVRGDPNYGLANCSIPAVNGVITGILPINKRLTETISAFETLQTNLMDPWDRPFVYAVTRNLSEAVSVPFDINGGKIDIKDESGENTGGVKGNAHFVVLSYGKNNTCPSTGLEAENCNGDEKFISSIRYDVSGPGHFDDRLAFYTDQTVSLWSRHLRTATYTDYGDAKNDNTGKIAIGVTNPTEKLSVGGDINVTGSVMSQKLCDLDASKCMTSESIYYITCATGTYLTAITLNATTSKLQPTCASLAFPAPATVTNCPRGVQGIFTDGTIRCAN